MATSNDELVAHLISNGHLHSEKVTEAFRSIDRAYYYKDGDKGSAYDGRPWKNGNLHLSAPSIYAMVLEGLQFDDGLSFLNLGSGTGYLSGLAGFLIGPNGINHGVELHQDVVEYARKKWKDVMERRNPNLEATFYVGNCLKIDLLEGNDQLYDRVYCGAGVPAEYEDYMKRIISTDGGILVMPFNGNLVRVTRTGQNSWESHNLCKVTFAELILPRSSDVSLCLGKGLDLPTRGPPKSPIPIVKDCVLKSFDLDRFENPETIDDSLICSICKSVLSEPKTIRSCEHSFCTGCITEWFSNKNCCPLDRQPATLRELQPTPRLVRNLLGKLKIKCDYEEFGCPCFVPLDRVMDHVPSCSYRKD